MSEYGINAGVTEYFYYNHTDLIILEPVSQRLAIDSVVQYHTQKSNVR